MLTKLGPTLDQIYKMVHQINPAGYSDFTNEVEGRYGPEGAFKRTGKVIRQQALGGADKVNYDQVNQHFAEGIQQALDMYAKGGSETQRAALRAYMQKIRQGVGQDDL